MPWFMSPQKIQSYFNFEAAEEQAKNDEKAAKDKVKEQKEEKKKMDDPNKALKRQSDQEQLQV